jgi:ferredoxin
LASADDKRPAIQATLPGKRWDLLRAIPGLKWLMMRRSFQFAVILPNLFLFYVFILAGFFGTPVGNRNIIIVAIWILWWFLLIALMVPFASRIWCTVCPLPFFGDWLQRRKLVQVRVGKTRGLGNELSGRNRRWPKRLANMWVQNIGFLTLCTFSAMLVTRPTVTAAVLTSFVALALVLGYLYHLRAFCNYVCPVSGFLGIYSMTSTIELRSKSPDECVQCKTKACRTGNDKAWGCPWFVYMGKLERNNYCGLCMECLKSCPNDNIALNVRPFASDIRIQGYDEAWKAFIMLALAMAYSVILLGPNGTIKDWANVTETGQWGGFAKYAAILWMSALVVLPGLFYGCAWAAKKLAGDTRHAMRTVFLGYSFIVVPLGLLAWIAFSVPLLLVNGSYILNVVSDPFGWGWDLFGTAGAQWTPLVPEYVVFFQLPLLGIGLYYAVRRGYQIGVQLFGDRALALRALVPIASFAVAVVCGFWVFFAG